MCGRENTWKEQGNKLPVEAKHKANKQKKQILTQFLSDNLAKNHWLGKTIRKATSENNQAPITAFKAAH